MLRIKLTTLFLALACVFAFAEDPCDPATIPACAGGGAIADGGLNTTAGPTTNPAYACGSSENTVWYGPFIVPASGTVDFNTCGSDYDTQLSVYTTSDGACTGVDTQVDCNDDDGFGGTGACGGGLQSSTSTAGLTPGSTIYVAVDGFGGSTGSLILGVDAATQAATDADPSCVAGPPPLVLVPTMTEWGLFLFGLGMVTIGLVFVYNKQRQLA